MTRTSLLFGKREGEDEILTKGGGVPTSVAEHAVRLVEKGRGFCDPPRKVNPSRDGGAKPTGPKRAAGLPEKKNLGG
jgi:hypothetical protein